MFATLVIALYSLACASLGAYLEAKFGAKELAKAKAELAVLKAKGSAAVHDLGNL